jgi:hypothetical protein
MLPPKAFGFHFGSSTGRFLNIKSSPGLVGRRFLIFAILLLWADRKIHN